MAEVNIGDYLFRRIAELGVRSVFGVPGGLSVHCPVLAIEDEIILLMPSLTDDKSKSRLRTRTPGPYP